MRNKGWFWHIHHDVLLEHTQTRQCDVTASDIKKRKDYIKREKDRDEIELRLKMIRPAKIPPRVAKELISNPAYLISKKVRRQILKLHEAQCHPLCPWQPYEHYLEVGEHLSGSLFEYWDCKRGRYWLKPLKRKKAKA